jgi:serine/threonine protein kinase
VKIPKGKTIESRFVVLHELGDGGMGTVFKVKDRSTAEVIALKACSDPENHVRFAREVRAMQRIQDPRVMPVLHASLDHEPPYFTMPLAENSIEDEIPVLANDEATALEVFKEICRGVEAIHEAGATHRDIKPANAMRMPDGSVVMADLGLAKFDSRDTVPLTKTSAILGTQWYCAPEQFLPGGSREADRRTDVFQLGKTLFHLVTGDPPVLMDFSKLPAGLAYVVQRATKDMPDQRYQTVGKLIEAIADYEQSKDPHSNPVGALASLLKEVEQTLKRGEYKTKTIESALHALMLLGDDPEAFLDWFDRLPDSLFPILAKKFASQVTPVLEAYARAIDARIHAYGFSYAETVASKMEKIFKNAKPAELKALALYATMKAAVDRHRYAAMEVFDQLLLSVTEPDDVAAVADMLEEHMEEYAVVADRISSVQLPARLRKVRDRAAKKRERDLAS